MKIHTLGWMGMVAAVFGCGGKSSGSANTGRNDAALSVAISGQGSVKSADGSVNCTASCSEQLAVGTAVHLDATPASGMQFMGWSGACSGTSSCELTLDSDRQVGATFAAGTVTLTVDPVGTGAGVVTSSPPGIGCPGTCSMEIAPGTPVTLTATANAGSHFEGYGGKGCSGLTCAFTVSTAVTVFANFSLAGAVQHTLSVAVTGAGTVASTPNGISCPGSCSARFAEGIPVALTATPAPGATFLGWTGACTGAGACSVALAADASVFAQFSLAAACAGLPPALPAAKTFTTPAGGAGGDLCGSATSDGLGNVYLSNGTMTASSAGAAVPGALIRLIPLRSGFATIETGMTFERNFTVFAPDGTGISNLGVLLTGSLGDQANGGTIITTVTCDASRTTADFEFRRFDDTGAQTSDLHLANQGCVAAVTPSAILVDSQDRTLIVYAPAPGDHLPVAPSHLAARWFDAAAQPITDWFDAGASASSSLALRPLIGGGAALRAGDNWVATFPSGKAEVGAAPAAFEARKDALIVLGGKAYAMVPDSLTAGSIDIVEPGGTSCGAVTTATAGDRFFTGKDGTLIDLTGPSPQPGGPGNHCTATYYPQVLK